jgi:hypothetical protein
MTQRRIRIKDDGIEVNVEGRVETDSFIHMDFDPEVVIL